MTPFLPIVVLARFIGLGVCVLSMMRFVVADGVVAVAGPVLPICGSKTNIN